MEKTLYDLRRQMKAALILIIVLYAVFYIIDLFWGNFIAAWMEGTELKFDFTAKASNFLTTYLNSWTVTVGVVVFVVQRGYGRIMGLQMGGIVKLFLGRTFIFVCTVFMLIKPVFYLIAYCYHFRCILFWGIFEVYLCFFIIVYFFIRLTDLELVNLLIKENIVGYYAGLPSVKLKQVACHVKYEDSEEVEAFIKLLDFFVGNITKPDELEGHCYEKHRRNVEDLEEIIYNTLFAVGDERKCERIVLAICEGKSAYNCFLIIRSIISDDTYRAKPEFIEKILYMEAEETRKEVLKCLIIYLELLGCKAGEAIWCDRYIQELTEEMCILTEDREGKIPKSIVLMIDMECKRLGIYEKESKDSGYIPQIYAEMCEKYEEDIGSGIK